MTRDDQTPSDPVFRSSLRELRSILVIWTVFLIWVVGYCGLFGYEPTDPTEETALKTILGMPSWVFGGIFIPWIVATIVICWFALTQIEDHPLQDPVADDESSDRGGRTETDSSVQPPGETADG